MQHPFQSGAVAVKSAAYPATAQARQLMRDLVFCTAVNSPGVGPLQRASRHLLA